MKNNLNELKKTLEDIRTNEYLHLPKGLIEEIVDIQFQNQDNPGKRQSETHKTIMKYANSLSLDDGGSNEI